MPTRIVNSKRLNNYYVAFAKPDTKTLITEVLGLYESGKIMHIQTARHILDKLTSNNKMVRERAIKEYITKQDTFKNKQSVIGKLKRETEQRQRPLGQFEIQYMLWREVSEEEFKKTKSRHTKTLDGAYYIRINTKSQMASVLAPSPFPK